MRFPKTSLAVALIAATLAVPAVAAPDMHHDHGTMQNGDMGHHNMGRHHGWSRHHGWHRHCWTRWRHHHAVRVCR